ncbi:MAG: hypothetical protein ACREJ3_05310 [Polyangiaceae bacterium]
MIDDPHPPAAIRVARPYATEDEFLDHEYETLTRTTVMLLGAPSRPQGVVVRFELVLATGQAIMKGEGRVVGFKPDVHVGDLAGTSGLTLRFTRIDSRSKAFIDKAAVLREARRPSTRPPPADQTKSRSPVPPAPSHAAHPPPQSTNVEPPPPPPASRERVTAIAASSPAAPAERDALLDRLRTRAKALDADTVRTILTPGRRSSR